MTAVPEHEAMAAVLEASGDYRVLRRMIPCDVICQPDGSPTRLGIFLDLETTGLDWRRDEIIEMAMVPFTYALDGRIFEIKEAFQGLRKPTMPIPAAVTKLTGIDAAMVAGQSIDPGEVRAFVDPAALVIAHNAAFDRRFAEIFCDVFATKPWACSMSQIPWAEEGFDGRKLGYLAAGCGFFYDAHRAKDDCLAAIRMLAAPLPKSHVPALARLLEVARQPTVRIWAENFPFDVKDVLKARGYHWNGESNGKPRAWYVDVVEDAMDDELAYLQSEIYRCELELPFDRITAYDRFSVRSAP